MIVQFIEDKHPDFRSDLPSVNVPDSLIPLPEDKIMLCGRTYLVKRRLLDFKTPKVICWVTHKML